jgi:hypothetical protein
VAQWRANRRGCCSLTVWPNRCFSPMCSGHAGSVLIVILLHASTNLIGVSPPIGPDGDLTVPVVALALKWVLAVALFVRLPRSFSDGSAEFQWSATPG